MTPAARDTIALGRQLAVVHFLVSFVLFGWLVLGMSKGDTVARTLAWQTLEVMHAPLKFASVLGVLDLFSPIPAVLIAGLLVLLGSVMWGLLTAGLYTWARNVFPT